MKPEEYRRIYWAIADFYCHPDAAGIPVSAKDMKAMASCYKKGHMRRYEEAEDRRLEETKRRLAAITSTLFGASPLRKAERRREAAERRREAAIRAAEAIKARMGK